MNKNYCLFGVGLKEEKMRKGEIEKQKKKTMRGKVN